MIKKDDYFSLWFPLGALIGITSTALAMLSIGATEFPAWVNKYQNLIAAALAIVTAWWTVRGTLRATEAQILHSQENEEVRRVEQLRAARALLSFSLTEVVEFCEAILGQLSDILNYKEPNNSSGDLIIITSGPSFLMPDVPVSALERIQTVIRYSSADDARELATLLSKTQILASRLKQIQEYNTSGFAGRGKKFTIIARLIDALELHARSNRSFMYARFEAEQLPRHVPEENELMNSVLLAKINIDLDELTPLIRERAQCKVSG